MKFSSDQTHLYPIPLFRHFVVNAFSICTHLTNVRLARKHHWLSQACLHLHYGLSSERLPHLARKVHDSGPRGVPFTATPSPKLRVLVYDQFFGYVVPFQGLRRYATHKFTRIRLSHILQLISFPGLDCFFALSESLCPHTFPSSVSPACDYANVFVSFKQFVYRLYSLKLRSYSTCASTSVKCGQQVSNSPTHLMSLFTRNFGAQRLLYICSDLT
jgi:hypothetical protein